MTMHALERGAVVHTPTHAAWDVSGRCDRPILLRQDGFTHLRTMGHQEPGRTLDMEVPCRKCRSCLRARAYQWGRAAVREWMQGVLLGRRTWFGTLTFGPEERAAAIARADLRLKAHVPGSGAVPVDTPIPPEESEWSEGLHEWLLARSRPSGTGKGPRFQGLASCEPADFFRELHRELGPVVTRYLKRLRKGNQEAEFAPAKFRYLLTVEPHKQDWMPHYHILVHESSDEPIRKAVLDGQWKAGFDRFRLVEDEKGAFYAAKYLGKLAIARVRASACYGGPPPEP